MSTRRFGLLICFALGLACSKREAPVAPPSAPAPATPSVGDVSPPPQPLHGAGPEAPAAVAAWFRGARLIPTGFEVFVALDVSALRGSPLWAASRKGLIEILKPFTTLAGCEFGPEDVVAVAGGFSMAAVVQTKGIVAVEGRDVGSDARLACLTDANPKLEQRMIDGRTAVVDKDTGDTTIVVSPDLVVLAGSKHVQRAIGTIDLRSPSAIETELQLELSQVSPRSMLWLTSRHDPAAGAVGGAGMPTPRHVSVVASVVMGLEVDATLSMTTPAEAESIADQARSVLPAMTALGVPQGVGERSSIFVAGADVIVQIRASDAELHEMADNLAGKLAPAPVVP